MNLSTHYTTFFAVLSCLGWIGMFAAKKSGNLWVGNCLGLVYHIALAPVVQALPAEEFVRIAGYFWIFCDALIDVCSINGMAEDNVWGLRMGVHIPASIWIIGSSLQMTTLPFLVGITLGAFLAVHAVIGPKLDKPKFKLFIFVLPMMTVWLVLVAFRS